MLTINDLLASMKEWKQPLGSTNPFKLACRIEPGATSADIDSARVDDALPTEIAELWLATREAWLFEDTEYGQWGLHLLPPDVSATRTRVERADRSDDMRSDDIVLGEFLGDQELLVFAPSEAHRRRILVALPLDPRDDWYAAGESVTGVLEQLLASEGEKYWER